METLNYKVETENGDVYAGSRLFIRDGFVWLINPYVGKEEKLEPMNIFRLGIPIEKVKTILQKERSKEQIRRFW